MANLNFHQIYPHQSMPTLAKDTDCAIPKRAKFFCHPFKLAVNKGIYAYPPIDFSVLVTEEYLDIKVNLDNGDEFTKRVNKEVGAANFVLLSDINKKRSENCLKNYRRLLKQECVKVPSFIEIDTFGFYEIFINIIVEEDPFDFYLQVWLGGVVEYEQDGIISIKHPTNAVHDSGYLCLDADIDTSDWKGWLAVVVKPTIKNQWITFEQNKPICQIIGTNMPITNLTNYLFEDINVEMFYEPLKWHLFDSEYGKKPGKYQRQINGLKTSKQKR